MKIYRIVMEKEGPDKSNPEYKTIYVKADGFDDAVFRVGVIYHDWRLDQIQIPEHTDFIGF